MWDEQDRAKGGGGGAGNGVPLLLADSRGHLNRQRDGQIQAVTQKGATDSRASAQVLCLFMNSKHTKNNKV